MIVFSLFSHGSFEPMPDRRVPDCLLVFVARLEEVTEGCLMTVGVGARGVKALDPVEACGGVLDAEDCPPNDSLDSTGSTSDSD